jgi:predicted RNA-binding protein YlqC (UPF0109 family)
MDNGVIKALSHKEFVELICKKIVNHPKEVVVHEIAGQSTSILEIKTHKEDAAIVIGKHGRTISSIRTLLIAVCGANKETDGKKYVIELLEDNRSRRK